MKRYTCTLAECLVSVNGKCHRGLELVECRNLQAPGVAAKGNAGKRSDGDQIQWSGLALGLEDIAILAARNRPTVIGIVGPHNAGKTTILSTIYLLLKRGKSLGAGRFAGSYSLDGWERIAKSLEWNSEDLLPSFPAHTEESDARTPGLLHIAVREQDGRLNDWLFTDAPGEWFRRWAIEENAADAQGAVWTAEQSNAFMFVIDCEALTSEERGVARGDYRMLIDRLSQVAKSRPVAVVWSKYDYFKEDSAIPYIKEQIKRKGLRIAEFKLSVVEDQGRATTTTEEFERLLEWFHKTVSTPAIADWPKRVAGNEFFLTYRGR